MFGSENGPLTKLRDCDGLLRIATRWTYVAIAWAIASIVFACLAIKVRSTPLVIVAYVMAAVWAIAPALYFGWEHRVMSDNQARMESYRVGQAKAEKVWAGVGVVLGFLIAQLKS
jgi:uncharacterized protein YacL